MSPQLKCYINWNVTITEISQNFKMFSNQNLKPEVGPDHLGLVVSNII